MFRSILFILIMLLAGNQMFGTEWKEIINQTEKSFLISETIIAFDLNEKNPEKSFTDIMRKNISLQDYKCFFSFFFKERIFEVPIINKVISVSILPEQKYYYVEEGHYGFDPPTEVFVTIYKNRVLRFRLRALEPSDTLFSQVRKIDLKNFNKINKSKSLQINDENDAFKLCVLFMNLVSPVFNTVLFKKEISEISISDITENGKNILQVPLYNSEKGIFQIVFFSGKGKIKKWHFLVKGNGEIELKNLVEIN